MVKKQGARRYQIERTPKAYVLRNKLGQFKKWVQKKWTVPADRRKKAKTKVKSGYGYKGDQRRK